MVKDYALQEGIKDMIISNVGIMRLLYFDNVVLLTHNLEDAQKMMAVLKAFCSHSGLIVNVAQIIKVMLAKTFCVQKPLLVYIDLTLIHQLRW